MANLAKAIHRKTGARAFDPECVEALPIGDGHQKERSWRCPRRGLDPVLRADCLGCPDWNATPEK